MPNPLKFDPSHTTMLRKKYMADMKRRFAKISRAIQELIVEDDALGLITSKPLTFQQQVSKQAWRFKSDANKLKEYRRWLQQQIDAKILTVHAVSGQPWTATYAESAYRKGMMKAYTQVHKQALAGDVAFYEGGKAQFLREAFASPVSLSKIELMYTRAFDELKGVTSVMGQQMSRILTAGMIKGDGPRAIARELRKNVAIITKRRALVIARTEVIYAHAEGQLDAFERLGVKELGLMAEWMTAGDDRVCENCGALEGRIFTVEEARGMLPLHPNCFISGRIGVYTSKGWKFIKSIQINDLVLTHKGRFCKVIQIYHTPKQLPDVVRLYVTKEHYLTMTSEHPVLIDGNWIPAKDISKGQTIHILASVCEQCGEGVPYFKRFCDKVCSGRYVSDRDNWGDEQQKEDLNNRIGITMKEWWDTHPEKKKERSIATSQQMVRQYSDPVFYEKQCLMLKDPIRRKNHSKKMKGNYDIGRMDGKKITRAAHKVTRRMAKEGRCPLCRFDVREKIRLVTNTPEIRKQSSERMRQNNPMYIPGVAKKVVKKNRKRLLLHPETHPNMVMAKRGFISSLERNMKCILESKGLRFVHQYSIGRYFIDFVLPKYKLAIEVDGLYWHQDKEKDLKRQRYIERKGWTVIRFDENQMKNIQNVKDELNRVLMNHNKQYHFLDMKIVKVEKWRIKRNRTLFNFSVEDDESYIAKGFVVHNCRCAWTPYLKGISKRKTKEEIRRKLRTAIPRWPSTKRKIKAKAKKAKAKIKK